MMAWAAKYTDFTTVMSSVYFLMYSFSHELCLVSFSICMGILLCHMHAH